MQPASYSFKATKELAMHWDYGAFITGSQALHMYLECSHHGPKLNHDNITEALLVAIIAYEVLA